MERLCLLFGRALAMVTRRFHDSTVTARDALAGSADRE
jgi:hypothetical protein